MSGRYPNPSSRAALVPTPRARRQLRREIFWLRYDEWLMAGIWSCYTGWMLACFALVRWQFLPFPVAAVLMFAPVLHIFWMGRHAGEEDHPDELADPAFLAAALDHVGPDLRGELLEIIRDIVGGRSFMDAKPITRHHVAHLVLLTQKRNSDAVRAREQIAAAQREALGG